MSIHDGAPEQRARWQAEHEERERQAIEKWQAAEKAAPAPGQAIFLEASGIFAFDYDDLKRDWLHAMEDISTARPACVSADGRPRQIWPS